MQFRTKLADVVAFKGGRSLFRTSMPIESVQAECERPDGIIELSERGQWHCFEDGKVYRFANIEEM